MSSIKAPMSSSYKAVFVLSILMIFVVIIGGAISGSKSVGFGVWYWGYTAWKMYKRDNDALISLQKIMLWFQAVAFSVALAVLLFSDSDVRRYVDITPLGLIILTSLSMGVTYLLYKFFKGQQNIGSSSALIGSNSSIDDRFWEQASRELEGDKHEATWARAMASAEGDDAKTKALYLKIRSSDLQRNAYSTYVENKALPNNDSGIIKEESKLFWSSFNQVGKFAIVGIVALIGYAIYDSYGNSNSTSATKTSSASPSTKSESSPANNLAQENCIFVWSDVQRTFVKVKDDIYDSNKYTNTIIIKLGKEAYAESLFAQLRKADAENNVSLAKSIAKEVRANALTVYYEKNLTSDYINLLANEHNLRSRCM